MSSIATEPTDLLPVITTVECDADGSIRLVPKELENQSALYYQGLPLKAKRKMTAKESRRLRNLRGWVSGGVLITTNAVIGAIVMTLGDPLLAAMFGFILLSLVSPLIQVFNYLKSVEDAIRRGEVYEFAEPEAKPDTLHTGAAYSISAHGHLVLSRNGKRHLLSLIRLRSTPVWLAKRGSQPGPLTIAERAEIVSRLMLRKRRPFRLPPSLMLWGAGLCLAFEVDAPWPVLLPFFATPSRTRGGPSSEALDKGLWEGKCVAETKYSKRLVLCNTVAWSNDGEPADWRSKEMFD